jgi:D-glycero-D-manno-heptose 1,7-bisphosphate phosphatase
MQTKAVFLDRDGVINQEVHYLHKIEDFVFLPHVREACVAFKRFGYRLVVVTNQSGIGQGIYSQEDYHRLTDWMREAFVQAGAPLDGVYHCPHHPTKGVGDYRQACRCRKPLPGMLLEAAKDLQIDLAQSVLVGDKESDVQAGIAAGLRATFLISTGHAIDAEGSQATRVVDDLLELVDYLESLD